MKDFYKQPYLKNSDVDMKKLQKQRMDDCGRMERRERDKLARQQIQNPTPEASLFPEPVRIEGDSTIESKLGDYSVARNLFSVEPTKHSRIIGITAAVTKPPVQRLPPQQPPPPFSGVVVGSSSSTISSSATSSSSTSTFAPPPSQSSRNVPPSHRYHQPHPPLSSSQQQSRSGSGTYLKQPDPKPTYNGRYPIAPINKHDSHQKNSILGPPPPSSSSLSSSSSIMPNGRLSDKSSIVGGGSAGGVINTSSSSSTSNNCGGVPIPNGRFQVPLVPKHHSKYPPIDTPLEPPSPSMSGDVEDILKEMTMRTNPVTEIAATPRKEFENKFSFGQTNNHVYAALPPTFKESFTKQRDKSLTVPKPTDLENDLELSESDDERKKQTPAEPASPTIDNSSDSSDTASSESESEESTSGNKGDASNQTSKWNLSKYFLKENNAMAQPSPHENNNQMHDTTNIKNEPNIIDDHNLSSPTPSPSMYHPRHETNQMSPLLAMNIKKEYLQDFNKVNNNSLELQPNLIKSETFEKSASSSPEKVQHSDTVESDQIESVLAEAKGLAELKPVSEIGTSSNEDELKKQQAPPPVAKSPVKKPIKKRRKVQKDKKVVHSDSSDEEDDFSSANTQSDRSRSTEKEKKARGRPRKNPIVTPPTASTKSPAKTVTPIKNSSQISGNKRDTTTITTSAPAAAAVRKTAAGRRSSRQNSMKSREILETTTDSSSDDDRPPPVPKSSVVPSPTLSASAMVIPSKVADMVNRGLLPNVPNHKSVAKMEITPRATKSSEDDDEDDDGDSSSSSNISEDERVQSSAERTSPRPPYHSRRHSSSQSHHSTSTSSEDHSDSDSDSPPREDKKIRDKTKSDKNKSDTLRKLFVMGPNRGEGGAKVKGQVLIVDQSEESQNHQTKDTQIIHHEKILSPIAFKQHTNTSNNNNNNSSSNDMLHHPPTSAVAALNHHLKSPRTSAVALVATSVAPSAILSTALPTQSTQLLTPPLLGSGVSSTISNNTTSNNKSPSTTASLRTPERITSSSNSSSSVSTLNSSSNKVHSSSNISSNVSANKSSTICSPIICRIDLSRLHQIPKAWYQNSYRIRDNSISIQSSNSSISNSTQIQSAPQDDEDRLRNLKLPLTPRTGSSSKLNHNLSEGGSMNSTISNIANNLSNNSRLANSDPIVNQTAASSPASSRPIDGGGISSKNNFSNNGSSCGNSKSHNNVANYPYNLDNHCNRLEKDPNLMSPSLQPLPPPSLPQAQSLISPKNEQLLHPTCMKSSVTAGGIKQESIKSEFTIDDIKQYVGTEVGTTSSKLDNKCNIYNNSKLGSNSSVKQEQFIKNEYKASFIANDCAVSGGHNNQTSSLLGVGDPIGGGAIGTVPPPMTSINASCVAGLKSSNDEPIPKNRRKRSVSSSSSPFKDKKRKKTGAQPQNEALEQLPPTNHDRLADKYSPPPPPPIIQRVYKSYFEREDEVDVRLIQEQDNYLQEAKRLKHLADREPVHFSQVTLYLKAVLYFLLSASGMEHTRLPSAYIIYKETLSLIKYTTSSSKLKLDTTNKVAILSYRCQSLILLKLYNLKSGETKEAHKTITQYFNKAPEILNGNTPSISPSSVSSLGSGSNTPPLHMVPVQVHAAFQKQHLAFNCLSSAHELWEQADSLVRKGNHMEFFIDLDRAHGPLTLHSSMCELFEYVQAGLQKLKEM